MPKGSSGDQPFTAELAMNQPLSNYSDVRLIHSPWDDIPTGSVGTIVYVCPSFYMVEFYDLPKDICPVACVGYGDVEPLETP